MQFTGCQEIVAILQSLSPLAWARCTAPYEEYGEQSRPPFIVFRFVQSPPDLEQRVLEVVTNFKGRLKWCMYRNGPKNNWVIEPCEVKQYLELHRFRTDVEGMDAYKELHPDRVKLAHEDLEGLKEGLAKITHPRA
ncbi:hypothetical protein [Calidithermus terrae]|uniref:hypothetical protein n=1 Tax=Calidithermus terrae TaxID=1408545 RepID=UPI0011C41F1D|nr:hypothetical protein [Calidithermus terrae]